VLAVLVNPLFSILVAVRTAYVLAVPSCGTFNPRVEVSADATDVPASAIDITIPMFPNVFFMCLDPTPSTCEWVIGNSVLEAKELTTGLPVRYVRMTTGHKARALGLLTT
jgi:hypothetical protein